MMHFGPSYADSPKKYFIDSDKYLQALVVITANITYVL